MKKTIALFLMLAAITGVYAQAPKTTWNLDQAHSSVTFSVDHMVISEVEGSFKTFSVDVKADNPDFTDATGAINIDVKSIDTDNTKRDEHLRSGDFFDATQFPTVSFKIAKFTKVSGKQYKVTGDLTIHGVTKTVTMDAKFNGIIKDPWGGTRTGIVVSGAINRYDYGLKYNAALEAGGVLIGEEVNIKVSLELIKAN